jgi:SAM-dependent methyltransferase
MTHGNSGSHHTDHDDPHNHKHTTMHPEILTLSDRFFESVDRQIVAWLQLAPGSRVLDAGCGGGGMTRLLAEAVGVDGFVIGLDANSHLLEHDRTSVKDTDLAERIEFREGDVRHLPFEDASFDLVWSSRVIHGLPDQLAGIRELRRVVRPGGRVVIREAGLPVQFLPFDLGIGEAGLEKRIQIVGSNWFANWRASLPGAVRYPFGWDHMLSEAGLSQVVAKSFLHEFRSPLEPYQREFLEHNLNRVLQDSGGKNLLSDNDMQALAQLMDKDSPHYIFGRDDLYGVGVETVFVGHAD